MPNSIVIGKSHQDSPWTSNWRKPFLRIGHAGAGYYKPKNSLESLALALQMGVDVVEFDVLACKDALVLLHSHDMAQFEGGKGLLIETPVRDLQSLKTRDGGRVATLQDALNLIKGRALMNVDLKARGYEVAVLDVIRAMDVMDDVLISSLLPESLRILRHLEPAIKTGISYSDDYGVATKLHLRLVVRILAIILRLTLPFRIQNMMTYAQADAVMLNYRLISTPTINRVHAARKRIFVWTVDDTLLLKRIQALSVDGIASNRPDLFN